MPESHITLKSLAEELHGFRRQVLEESRLRDADDEVLMARVTALEEVAAARWPRRLLLAARLRRDLRAATENIEAGGSFADRRAEHASLEVHPGGRS